MGRKVIAFWLSLAMVFSFIVVLDVIIDFTPTVRGSTLYVNTTGAGGAFTSIQDAINASKDGDTIFVYSGTYYENVLVNKTLNLVGEDRNNTIIDGGHNGDVVNFTADWVNMTGFMVRNSSIAWPNYDAGIEICWSSYFKVSNCNILNNFYGIYIYNSSGSAIIDNIFSLNEWSGIIIYESSSNKITSNNISNNDWGISIVDSSTNDINGNNIISNEYGISLSSSNGNNITGNNASNNNIGINIKSSNQNDVIGNTISSNDFSGIYLDNSIGNNIKDNVMINDGIYIWSFFSEHWNTHDIDTSNTVNSKPVYYLKNQTGGTIPSGAGQVILANCTNIKVENQSLNHCSVGILLGFSSNINIVNNNISNNFRGIRLDFSSNNNILGNIITLNTQVGIYLGDSLNNNITNNDVFSNNEFGIFLWSSSANTVEKNNITTHLIGINLGGASNNNNIISNNISNNSEKGIILYSSSHNNTIKNNMISSNNDHGIYFDESSNNNIIAANTISLHNEYGIFIFKSEHNNIIGNTVSNNYDGIYIATSSNNNIISNNVSSNNRLGIYLSSSNNNIIFYNNISSNNWGIRLQSSSNNHIYHNNIIENTNQAYDVGTNFWNESYPSGGNYWSDYGGVDNYKGPNQDLPGKDGIGDTNYSIDLDSIDNYPLIGPYPYFPTENYIILKRSWNLISIPLIQVEQNLIKVLETVDGYYNAVQCYDITDPNDHWKHQKVGKPYGNDLSKINETMGFWIHITQPGDTIFLYNGTKPTVNQTITLYPGWNLVGYPSLINYNRTKGLNNLTFGTHVDVIWTYYAATQKWKEIGPSDYFEIGRGYWIHAKTKCEWKVPL